MEVASVEQLLDNVIFESLAGAQSRFAEGPPHARRYRRGIAGLAGFADRAHPDFDALAPFCEAGEPMYCIGWTGKAPPRWRIVADTAVHQFVWDAPPPHDPADAAIRLAPAHVDRMVALAALTRPGPFGPSNFDLGEFYGVLEGESLLAMAGERLEAGPLREVSAVCTRPGFEGRGLARRLMERVVRLQLARGQVPFLHVMDANTRAREIYSRMGFRHRQQLPLRVVARA
jgi:GNAT superfamily N-acetyltransferase